MIRATAGAVVLSLFMWALGSVPDLADASSVDSCSSMRDLGESSLVYPTGKPSPDAEGNIYPVVLVHGYADTSRTWTKPATATWSATPVTDPKSFVEQIADIPGAFPVLFDYGKNSLAWVTDESIGAGLGAAIRCLAREAGNQVALVAHSMGGLAAREALNDASVAAETSLAITLGTPNLGSFWPLILSSAAIGAEVVDRWIQTASRLGLRDLKTEAFHATYRAVRALLHQCSLRMASDRAAGVCGEITPIVAAVNSDAGRGFAAGSQQLAVLPDWPGRVRVHALASNFLGPGPITTWVGDFIVPPQSSVAGAANFTATQCTLSQSVTLSQWVLEVRSWDGCRHSLQPVNRDLSSLVMRELLLDIETRHQPPTDWHNTTYETDCGGLVSGGFSVEVVDGMGSITDSGENERYEVTVEAVSETVDLTGDTTPETAVLLLCSGPSINYFTQEVQVFSEGAELLDELPDLAGLDPYDGPLAPEFDGQRFAIEDGQLVTGVDFYAPTDTHADGPSIHQTLVWRWDGHRFVT